MLLIQRDGYRQRITASRPDGPPYPPRTATLGGIPEIIPDVPVSAVFLALYVLFGAIHFSIFRSNNVRGHKFLWSAALGGFCILRIITMCLRIAWANHQKDVNLGVAAQIFVYVGTMILFVTNWFLTERIIRAQHPRWGWSRPFLIFHRLALVCLVSCLFMLLTAAIQQVFTLNPRILNIDRILQLVGQTYFAAFCLAPIGLILVSLIIPRTRIEKFGAGRLRINVGIIFAAAFMLLIGTVFRCFVAWHRPVPIRNAQGRPNPTPWYLSKVCFYTFYFATEFCVVLLYALTRIDIRFYVEPVSKGKEKYTQKPPRTRPSRRGTQEESEAFNDKGFSAGRAQDPEKQQIADREASLGDGTSTLVDPYRYPSSILEVDPDTGHWKIQPAAQRSVPYKQRFTPISIAAPPYSDIKNDSSAPPLPPVPDNNWPLRESQVPKDSVPVLEHVSRKSTSAGGSSASGSREFNSSDQSAERPDPNPAVGYAISRLQERTGQSGVYRHRSDPGRRPAVKYEEDSESEALDSPIAHNARVSYDPGPRSGTVVYRQVHEDQRGASASASVLHEGEQRSSIGSELVQISSAEQGAHGDEGDASLYPASSVYSGDNDEGHHEEEYDHYGEHSQDNEYGDDDDFPDDDLSFETAAVDFRRSQRSSYISRYEEESESYEEDGGNGEGEAEMGTEHVAYGGNV